MSEKKDYGYIPPKPPKLPSKHEDGEERGYVPPKPPVKPPQKPSTEKSKQ